MIERFRGFDEGGRIFTIGEFHCPMCFQKRFFLVWEINDPPETAECQSCGYKFGRPIQEKIDKKGRLVRTRVDVLSQARITRAKDKANRDFQLGQIANGVRREEFLPKERIVDRTAGGINGRR